MAVYLMTKEGFMLESAIKNGRVLDGRGMIALNLFGKIPFTQIFQLGSSQNFYLHPQSREDLADALEVNGTLPANAPFTAITTVKRVIDYTLKDFGKQIQKSKTSLTPQQQALLSLVARGYNSKEIGHSADYVRLSAKDTPLSPQTVAKHKIRLNDTVLRQIGDEPIKNFYENTLEIIAGYVDFSSQEAAITLIDQEALTKYSQVQEPSEPTPSILLWDALKNYEGPGSSAEYRAINTIARHFGNKATLEEVANKPDEELLAIKNIGPLTLNAFKKVVLPSIGYQPRK